MDDPRDLDMAPDQGQESPDYAPSGGWYPGEEEPHAWAEDGVGSDLLPGLDPEQGSRGGTGGGSGGKARKKGRRRVRIILLAILTVFVLVIVAAGGVGYHYYKTYIDPPDFSGPGTGTVVVQIKPGPVRRPDRPHPGQRRRGGQRAGLLQRGQGQPARATRSSPATTGCAST